MSEITFTNEQREEIALKLQNYFEKELDFELEQFDAMFLLDFFHRKLAHIFIIKGYMMHLPCSKHV